MSPLVPFLYQLLVFISPLGRVGSWREGKSKKVHAASRVSIRYVSNEVHTTLEPRKLYLFGGFAGCKTDIPHQVERKKEKKWKKKETKNVKEKW